MQWALILLFQQAIEIKYTDAICNRITGQLPGGVRLLKHHLFDMYGKINENKLQEKYDTATKLAYIVSEPIVTIFLAVKDLCEIA